MQVEKTFPIWFGLDVSKETFTAAEKSIGVTSITYPKQPNFAISTTGVREFMKWAKSLAGDFAFGIAMEATGIYSRKLSRLILRICPLQHVSVCNAAAISWYVKSYTDEKNDKADAAFIARFACDRNPGVQREVTETEARLKEAVRERNRLVESRLDLKNAMESIEDKEVRKLHKKVIDSMDRVIEKLEKTINEIVDSNEKIKDEVKRMATAPGVGMLSAACIYAELGSMVNYTRKQISAMSGVCPVNKESGTSVHRHTMSKRGSKMLRKILFLDSFQAILRMPAMSEFYKRMLAKSDSSKMSARCACMRKLLLILHGMVVNGCDFNPDYKPKNSLEK